MSQAVIPDFETRGVILKDFPGDQLGYALVFKTAKDRRAFTELALSAANIQSQSQTEGKDQ